MKQVSLTKPLQKVIVLLNFRPITYFLRAIYAFGLKRLVSRLEKHPAVYAVLGHGSFFEGGCLYGLSDIDLAIIIDESFSRNDAVHHEIALVYNRARRFFPFLQSWHELADNLVFLSELQAGFPPPQSLTFRAKQGRLFKLYGAGFDDVFPAGPLNTNDAVEQIDDVLRMALMKGEIHTSNLLFWKRIFSKFIHIVDVLGLPELAAEMRDRNELSFLSQNDVFLFIRKSAPNDRLFPLILEFSQRISTVIRKREDTIRLDYSTPGDCQPTPITKKRVQNGKKDDVLSVISEFPDVTLKMMPSSLFGIAPRLNYLPIDKPIPIISSADSSYDRFRSLARTILKYGEVSECFIVQTPFHSFIMLRLSSHVDIIPLNPFIHANILARISEGQTWFEMPVSIYTEQKAIADRAFFALAGLYKKNEGWIKKLSFPCIYMEDDLPVIQDAFHRMRAFLALSDGVDAESSDDLIDFLRRRHPNCRSFLMDLLEYYGNLTGRHYRDSVPNNLYRCLLQFMSQLLSGKRDISIDDHKKRLGISVGIITRNRATDLQKALESLTRQIRPPDEVLILDNGSVDHTRDVIDTFREVLPISYLYLKEPGIPNARNMVIENAKYEIISFTDDDCIIEEEWLNSVERGFLRADNVGIVGGWVRHEPATRESMIDTYYSLFHHNKS